MDSSSVNALTKERYVSKVVEHQTTIPKSTPQPGKRTTTPRLLARSTTPTYEPPPGPYIPPKQKRRLKSRPVPIQTPSGITTSQSVIYDRTNMLDLTTSPTVSPPPSIFQFPSSTIPLPRISKPLVSTHKRVTLVPPKNKPINSPQKIRSKKTLNSRKAQIDWKLCDPRAKSSNLLRMEYLFHGNPTFRQSTSGKGAKEFFRSLLPPPKPIQEVTWAKKVNMGVLGNALLMEEAFLVQCWVRDIIGEISEEDILLGGPLSSSNKPEPRIETLRLAEVGGISLYLIGEEFPCAKVMITGIVLDVELKLEKNVIIYSIDDSTGVIRCTCALKGEVRRPQSLTALSSIEISQLEKELQSKKQLMKIGALVQVSGSLESGLFQGSDLGINVNRIATLSNPNDEILHHIEVARLHREVYNQRPLDVASMLNQIKLRIKEERALIYGSQAPSSSGSTMSSRSSPSKVQTAKTKCQQATKIPKKSLTIPKFTTYITYFLLKKIKPTSTQSFSTSSTDSQSFDQDETHVPNLFSLELLKKVAALRLFAELLADSQDPRINNDDPNVEYSWEPDNEMQSSTSRKPSQLKVKLQLDLELRGKRTPQEEEVYQTKVKREFIKAIQSMLASGKIIIAEPIPVIVSPKKRIVEAALPDEPVRRVKKPKPSAPWDLSSDSEMEVEVIEIVTSKRPTGSAPWDSNDTECTPLSPSPSPIKSKSFTASSVTPKKPLGWSLAQYPSPYMDNESTPKAAPNLIDLPPIPIFRGFNTSAAGPSIDEPTMFIEVDELYELVCRATLFPSLLRIIKNETIASRKGRSSHRIGSVRQYGVNFRGIHACLVRDSRFERISEKSTKDSLAELVEMGAISISEEMYSVQ